MRPLRCVGFGLATCLARHNPGGRTWGGHRAMCNQCPGVARPPCLWPCATGYASLKTVPALASALPRLHSAEALRVSRRLSAPSGQCPSYADLWGLGHWPTTGQRRLVFCSGLVSAFLCGVPAEDQRPANIGFLH
ncbi:hypothetical protein HALTITAN_0884 [Vreelandella titanicae BH1]|uniref:Uncharacterized protein n=1 Tax=Vreelandella titanicae BH1 TaxID=1204738 RepID=L9UDJ3_9GAMM|nr:hypothetical protein HALTITAN_0884 [Halomonas titanicae BH1]